MKKVEFTHGEYVKLLNLLGSNAPASTPVKMQLKELASGQNQEAGLGYVLNNYNVRLIVASVNAPKEPIITFDKQDEYGTWYTITNEENGNHDQVIIEILGENNEY